MTYTLVHWFLKIMTNQVNDPTYALGSGSHKLQITVNGCSKRSYALLDDFSSCKFGCHNLDPLLDACRFPPNDVFEVIAVRHKVRYASVDPLHQLDGSVGLVCYDCAWLSLTALSTVTCNLWL
jgi:hypothetical protein